MIIFYNKLKITQKTLDIIDVVDYYLYDRENKERDVINNELSILSSRKDKVLSVDDVDLALKYNLAGVCLIKNKKNLSITGKLMQDKLIFYYSSDISDLIKSSNIEVDTMILEGSSLNEEEFNYIYKMVDSKLCIYTDSPSEISQSIRNRISGYCFSFYIYSDYLEKINKLNWHCLHFIFILNYYIKFNFKFIGYK